MFTQKYTFDGSFESKCQANSVPPSLVSLDNMTLYGPNIEMQASTLTKFQSDLTISQLLQYNSYHRRSSGEVKQERRNKSRETPLPIFVGLSIHAKTRSRDLVENMHTLGLSVSYDGILYISTDLGNAVCRRYQEENVVCPCNLRLNLFTTAAVDNIPQSTILVLQLHKILSTGQESRCFNTQLMKYQAVIGDASISHKPQLTQNQWRNYPFLTQRRRLQFFLTRPLQFLKQAANYKEEVPLIVQWKRN